MALNIQAVVSLDTKMFAAGIRGIEAQVNQFAGLAMMQFGGIAQQVSAMWGAFGPAGGAITALGAIVQAGASYEQQMARVSSYTGEAGETIARLASQGGELAASFGFSLDQVGESMASLALAGVECRDMVDVLQPSLLLAGATLGDANQTAEAITSTLKVFQLEMGKATHVADMFAGAIASSPLDMQRLTDAMKYAGATGAAYSMSMEQVVSEIAAFHQVGLRGQLAGTAFRGALLEMAAAASSAKGQVGSALQGWIPATEGLTGAVRRLNDAGVDAADVIQELGKRAGPGVAALMQFGADAMDDLAGKVQKNANVSKMYGVQMDTLSGQFKLLKGDVAQFASQVYQKLLPGLTQSLGVIKEAVENFKKFAAAISGPASSAINILLPGVVRLTTTIIALNGAMKMLGTAGLISGPTSIAGILGQYRTNAAAAAASVAKLQEAQSALNVKSAQLYSTQAILQEANKRLNAQFAAGTIAQGQYAKMTGSIGGKLSGVSRGITAVNAELAANATALTAATKASGSFLKGIGLLKGGLLGVAAWIGGGAIGNWIKDINVAGQSIEVWASHAMSALMGLGLSTEELSGEMDAATKNQIEYYKKLNENIRATVKELTKADFASLGNNTAYREHLAKLLSEVESHSAQMKEELAAAFDFKDVFDPSKSGLIPRIKEFATEAKEVLDGAFSGILSDEADEMRSAISKLSSDAASLRGSIAEKEERLAEARREDRKQLALINDLQGRILGVQGAIELASGSTRTAYQREISVLQDKLELMQANRDEAAKGMYALENGMIAEKAKVADLNNELETLRGKLEELSAWNESALELDAKNAAEDARNVADVMVALNASASDARAAVAAIGNGWSLFSAGAQNAGIAAEQVGKNLAWMNAHQEEARPVLEALGLEAEKVTMFMAKYGERCYDVALRISSLGESEEQAAAALGLVGKKLEDTGDDAKAASDSIKELAANGKVVDQFASMSSARLERLKNNLVSLFNTFNQAGMRPGAIDLSWMRDLGAMGRLPKLTGVDSWIGKFRDFVTGVSAAAAQGQGIKLDWVERLKGFSLPNLGDTNAWNKAFGKWVSAVRQETPSLERFADVLQKLNGSLAALDGATLSIVFKDADLLSRIESHLSTLASLKGVIWA